MMFGKLCDLARPPGISVCGRRGPKAGRHLMGGFLGEGELSVGLRTPRIGVGMARDGGVRAASVHPRGVRPRLEGKPRTHPTDCPHPFRASGLVSRATPRTIPARSRWEEALLYSHP